ncbi:IS66 family transposase [Mesorhizobium sp. ORM6]
MEDDLRGRSADQRRATVRKTAALWSRILNLGCAKVRPDRSEAKLAQAIHALKLGLSRFVDDGRIEIDSNTVERSIRGVALNARTRSSLARTAVPKRGGDCIAARDPQAQWCPATRLSRRRPHQHARTAIPTAGSTTCALGGYPGARAKGRGLRTPLDQPRQPIARIAPVTRPRCLRSSHLRQR